MLKSVDKICVPDKDKAKALNTHFMSVFTVKDAHILTQGPSPFKVINNLQIETIGVIKQLLGLKTHKACGPNKLPARVLH